MCRREDAGRIDPPLPVPLPPGRAERGRRRRRPCSSSQTRRAERGRRWHGPCSSSRTRRAGEERGRRQPFLPLLPTGEERAGVRWGGWRWPASAASSCYPDQGAVHGARRLGEDRAMMCGRESHGATAKETSARLARRIPLIPLIPLNPGESRMELTSRRVPLPARGVLSRYLPLASSCPDLPGLVPGISISWARPRVTDAWMAGTSPAMTA